MIRHLVSLVRNFAKSSHGSGFHFFIDISVLHTLGDIKFHGNNLYVLNNYTNRFCLLEQTIQPKLASLTRNFCAGIFVIHLIKLS
jgi:hypothetical protein